MMKSKYEGHTKGPLRYDEITLHGTPPQVCVRDSGGKVVAGFGAADDPKNRANGALFADAPTLLAQRDTLAEALRGLLAVVSPDGNSDERLEVEPYFQEPLIKVWAALAQLDEANP